MREGRCTAIRHRVGGIHLLRRGRGALQKSWVEWVREMVGVGVRVKVKVRVGGGREVGD